MRTGPYVPANKSLWSKQKKGHGPNLTFLVEVEVDAPPVDAAVDVGWLESNLAKAFEDIRRGDRRISAVIVWDPSLKKPTVLSRGSV